MDRYLRFVFIMLLSLVAAACDIFDDYEPPPDAEEIALTETAFAAAMPAFQTEEQATLYALETQQAPTATPTLTPEPSATPSPTVTPTPTPTPNATQVALAKCLVQIIALAECVNKDVAPIIFTDGAPNHQIVNNSDPTTLYRSPDILEMLGAPGVTMVHNYYTRPDNCPIGTPCVLHLLMIEFTTQENALGFFERVTQIGMEGETIIPAPNADVWDASKCATGTRPSSTAGAPPFAVIYCSGSLGTIHWGFNLSAYETLPESFVTAGLGAVMAVGHDYLSAWQSNVAGGAPVEVHWLTTLSGASALEQVAANFNLGHSGIKLIVDVVDPNIVHSTLAGEIVSGGVPDIVGPLPFSDSAAFQGQWLDLAPLIDQTNYDLNQFPKDLVDFYKTDAAGQIGLPFDVFPSALYYNRGLFDEAGLEYPPASYGEQYGLPDGSEADWNYDTLRQVAQLLTLDANGHNATEQGFDPSAIVQYGYEPYNQDLRAIGSYFGAGSLVSAGGQTAVIPAAWNDAWHWVYGGVWTDHFIANQAARESAEFGSGNLFNAGKAAMALTNLQYICCLADAGSSWDIAAVPSYNGQTTANLGASTFHILKTSENPGAAFEVLTYLTGEASPALLEVHGGMPARTAGQAAYFQTLNEQFPQGVHWQTAIDSIAYADNPSFEAFVPNYSAAVDRTDAFLNQMYTTQGLDLDPEIKSLLADLQEVYDKQ